MAIALHGTELWDSGAATTTPGPVPIPAGVADGDLVEFAVLVNGNTIPPGPTGWDLRVSGSTTGVGVGVYTTTWRTGDPMSVSWTGTSFRWAVISRAFGGIDTTTPLDSTPGTRTAGTDALTYPAVDVTSTGAWVQALGAVVASTKTVPTFTAGNMDQVTAATGSTAATTNVFEAVARATGKTGTFTPTGPAKSITTTRTLGLSWAYRPAPVGVTVEGAGNLTATANRTGTAVLVKPGAGNLTVTADRTGTAALVKPGAGTALTSTAQLTGTAGVVRSSSGQLLQATAVLEGEATTVRQAAADLQATATLEGSGSVVRATSGNLQASADVVGTGAIVRPTTGHLEVAAQLEGTASVVRPTAGSLEASATITGSATVTSPTSTAGDLEATADLAGAGTVDRSSAGQLQATALLEGTGSVVRLATGQLEATAQLTGAAATGSPSGGQLEASALIAGDAAVVRGASGDLVATAVLDADVSSILEAAGDLTVAAVLEGMAGGKRPPQYRHASAAVATPHTAAHVRDTGGVAVLGDTRAGATVRGATP